MHPIRFLCRRMWERLNCPPTINDGKSSRLRHAVTGANRTPSSKPCTPDKISMQTYVGAPQLPSDDKRWKIVEATARRHGREPHALIETLHTVQECFGY